MRASLSFRLKRGKKPSRLAGLGLGLRYSIIVLPWPAELALTAFTKRCGAFTFHCVGYTIQQHQQKSPINLPSSSLHYHLFSPAAEECRLNGCCVNDCHISSSSSNSISNISFLWRLVFEPSRGRLISTCGCWPGCSSWVFNIQNCQYVCSVL